MKKLCVMILVISFSSSVFAGPGMGKEHKNHKEQIKEALKSGKISKEDAMKLREAHKKMKKAVREAKKDGKISAEEKKKLDKMKKKLGREIKRKKNS